MTLPDIPEIGLVLPRSILAAKAFDYAREHCDEATYNHVARTAYWALLIHKKLPELRGQDLDAELVLVASLLHDMGWATSRGLLSRDKRFEVDGANIARDFIRNLAAEDDAAAEGWDEARMQRCWDAIALHTTSSIARFAAPEVMLTELGVMADFAGPRFRSSPDGPALIAMEEYHAVMRVFPRAGFDGDKFKGIICNLCATKPDTTHDNFTASYGLKYGIDGRGGGKEEFARSWVERQSAAVLPASLDYLALLDRTQ